MILVFLHEGRSIIAVLLIVFTKFFVASVEACQRNIKFNGSVASSKVESNLADARVYMLTHPKEFEVVWF